MNIDELLNEKEGKNIEFKRAKSEFDFEKLKKYVCAISNAGGGKIIFGISDKRPRRIEGSKAFPQPEDTCRSLIDILHIEVDFDVYHENLSDRVLAIIVPPRPLGLPVQLDGVAWWRKGDSLIPMPEEVRRKIYEEGNRDFSADICEGAQWSDLDPNAIEEFRKIWMDKQKAEKLGNYTREQLLSDCEAITSDGKITYAALILFGTREALGRFLSNSEVIFEYRVNEASGQAGVRHEFREGFFSFFDQLWELINLRNLKLSYQEGFFLYDIYAYNERAVREAVLNAVSHRNYQLHGSVFVKQYPDKIVIESPGGFIDGITPENVIDKQAARNKRLAEILSRCGLVERAGQGMNLIYETSIKEAKALPDFKGTDDYLVRLTLGATIVDDSIIKLFKEIGEKTLESFSTLDFLIVRLLLTGKNLPLNFKTRAKHLVDIGIIESVGRDKFLVSRKYYQNIGKAGTFTRLRGLDSSTNMELLKRHMYDMGNNGVRLADFQEVLPALGIRRIQWLLKKMLVNGVAITKGKGSAARWYLVDESHPLNNCQQVDNDLT